MSNRFVIDTVGFINYFNIFFEEENRMSGEARKVISKCLDQSFNQYKLIIPSIVFVEIFKKFLSTQEISRRFYYEVFTFIKDLEDVEIKGIEKEVLNILYEIGPDYDLELHDKLIYASAVQLECALISNDPKIIRANKKIKGIPLILF